MTTGESLWKRMGSWIAVAGIVGIAFLAPLEAQDSELRNELNKLVTDAKKDLVEAITKTVRDVIGDEGAHAEFVKAVSRVVEKRQAQLKKRVGELEKSLAAKDRELRQMRKKIAALEKRVAELAKTEKPVKQPQVVQKVEKPQKVVKQTNAFLGVGHLAHKDGAQVTAVQPESPAAKAGLAPNDVIVSVGGEKATHETLGRLITSHEPDTKVKIEILRGGAKKTLEAKLADREKFFAAHIRPSAPEKKPVFLGIWVEELPSGVVVDEVDDGYTGHVAGLKKGDRITHVNDKAVKTNDQLAGALKKIMAGEKFRLTTVREKEVVEIALIGSADKGGAKLIRREVKTEPPAEVRRKPAFLGVAVVQDEGGITVDGVVPETAAEKAGIRPGDVLKEVAGKKIGSVGDLRASLGEKKAGDKVRLVVQRGAKTLNLDVSLGAAPSGDVAKVEPEKPEKHEKPEKPEKPRKKGVMGIMAQEFDDDTVVVKEVSPGGPAAKAGLKAGDVILKLNGRAIKNFEDLTAALEGKFAGDELRIQVKRGDEQKDIRLKLQEPEE